MGSYGSARKASRASRRRRGRLRPQAFPRAFGETTWLHASLTGRFLKFFKGNFFLRDSAKRQECRFPKSPFGARSLRISRGNAPEGRNKSNPKRDAQRAWGKAPQIGRACKAQLPPVHYPLSAIHYSILVARISPLKGSVPLNSKPSSLLFFLLEVIKVKRSF